jgi:hypothetical protein
MSAIRSRTLSYLAWFCAFAGVLLPLSGCHYTEEQKWDVCCVLYIIKEKPPSQPERATIIEWQAHTWFHGRGVAGDSNTTDRAGDTNKKRQIRLEIANFLADSPGSQASDYFRSLGMACDPVTSPPKSSVTRCLLELPIQVRCGPTYGPLPGTTPIPKEMQEPLPALLRMSVDVSADTLVGVTTRIDPVPGGHLCHR